MAEQQQQRRLFPASINAPLLDKFVEFVQAGRVRENVRSYGRIEDILVTVVDNKDDATTENSCNTFLLVTQCGLDTRKKQGFSVLSDKEHERAYNWVTARSREKLTYAFARPNDTDTHRGTDMYYAIPRTSDFIRYIEITGNNHAEPEYSIVVNVLKADSRTRTRGLVRLEECEVVFTQTLLSKSDRFLVDFFEHLSMLSGEEYFLRVTVPSDRFLEWYHVNTVIARTIANLEFKDMFIGESADQPKPLKPHPRSRDMMTA